MLSDRGAILHLLAMGRVSAAEAERLLAVASAERENLWAMACCAALIVVAEAQAMMPGWDHAVKAMLAGGLPGLHHAFTVIAGWASGA